MNYFQHNDERGRLQRLRVSINHAERARLRALEQDADFGLITLVISKHDLQARLRESAYTGTTFRV